MRAFDKSPRPGLQMATFCAPMLTTRKVAALRCSKLTIFAIGLSNFSNALLMHESF